MRKVYLFLRQNDKQAKPIVKIKRKIILALKKVQFFCHFSRWSWKNDIVECKFVCAKESETMRKRVKREKFRKNIKLERKEESERERERIEWEKR